LNLPLFIDGFTTRDLIDILAVTIVVYNLLKLIRGTRAVQVIVGILVLAGISSLARVLGLVTLETVLANFIVILPFAILVMFQDQIRRALATFGDASFWGLVKGQDVESTASQVLRACEDLAKRRIGALIVIEGSQGLRDFIERGVGLDARVSSDLLCNIFSPGAPLHDGAVIIEGNRVAAAACFLPLGRESSIDHDLGTRHRAALGIAEQTDAIAVVVSEETGEISLARNGTLFRNLDPVALREALLESLRQTAKDEPAASPESGGDGADTEAAP